jgi:hypothetical protein
LVLIWVLFIAYLSTLSANQATTHYHSGTVHGLFIHSFIQAKATGYRAETFFLFLSMCGFLSGGQSGAGPVEKHPRDKKKNQSSIPLFLPG